MTTLPDAFATANAPISAYMSGHENANLAYVRYFGKKPEATSATFRSLNQKGFLVAYKIQDGSEHEVFIEYTSPVTKREDIRVVLESMANEAETALGMPSSMNGPPPFKALKRAAEIEDSLAADTGRQPKYQNIRVGGAIDPNAQTSDGYPKDIFYHADTHWMVVISAGLGIHAFMAYASDGFILKHLPHSVISFRQYITMNLLQNAFKLACAIHIAEASYALLTCVKRGWYNPINTVKWTISTLFFGVASLSKLSGHGNKVKRLEKKD